MALNDKIEDVKSKLSDLGIEAEVSTNTKGFLIKKNLLKVRITDVSDDISTSSSVQQVLRDVVGYGQILVGYNPSKKILNLEYEPLVKITGTETVYVPSRFASETTRQRRVESDFYRAPGCTPYNK